MSGATVTEKAAGSCLCGAVKYELDGTFEGFFLCHCSRCRKGTGSSHGANLVSQNAKLRWLAGEANVKTYQVAGTRHQRSFCAECGSALPKVLMDGAMILTPAGSVDTPVNIRPTAHICMSSRAAWDEGLETVPKLDGMPG